MESLNGHEAGNGGYSQGDTYGNSPFLDPTKGWLEVQLVPTLDWPLVLKGLLLKAVCRRVHAAPRALTLTASGNYGIISHPFHCILRV